MNRNYFIEKAAKSGFVAHNPESNTHAYFQREFLKYEACVIGLSAPNTSIDITVYDLTLKLYKKFESYSDAWKYIATLHADGSSGDESKSSAPVRHKRKKT